MVYRRRYAKKKRTTYRKKGLGFRRRYRRTGINAKVYNYKQSVSGTQIGGIAARTIAQTAGAQNFACEFQASDIGNWSNFASIYDQYRINKIVVKFIPMMSVNAPLTLTGSSLLNPGVIASVIDYDDSVALGALTEYRDYQNFKMLPAISTRTMTRSFVPAIRGGVLNAGGAMLGGNVKRRQWLDCAESNLAHNGLKIYIDGWGNANAPQVWQVEATYYVSFRSVR